MTDTRFQKALKDSSLSMTVREDWGAKNPQHRDLIYAALDKESAKGIYSSVSHAEPEGGFAISQFPLGFDIEKDERVTDKIIARVSKEEEMNRAPNNAALWCAKEATFKALRNFRQPETVSQIEIEFTGEVVSDVHLFKVKNEKNFDALNSLGGTFSASGLTYCIIIFRP